MLDLALWLDPIDGNNPSGRDLREDPEFDALGRLLQQRVDIVRDDRNNPVSMTVVPVDWAAVLSKADTLRARGRDLRLLVIVTRALFNERGIGGLAEGLTLLAKTCDLHWDSLHPALRLAGRPMEAAQRRIAALRSVEIDAGAWKKRDKDKDEFDRERPEGVLGELRCRVFFNSRDFGPVTGRDLEQGGLDGPTMLAEAVAGLPEAERASRLQEHNALVDRVRNTCVAQIVGPPPEVLASLPEDARAVEAERTRASRAEMEQTIVDIRATLAALDEVERVFGAKLGEPVSMPALRRALDRIQATLERSAAGAAKLGGPAAVPAAASEAAGAAPAVAPVVAAAPAVPGQITSREEVVACLDRIIEFYDRTEPSSPVPFLARRLRRMVPMDFLTLIEDLAPSGLKEFRQLAGLNDDKK